MTEPVYSVIALLSIGLLGTLWWIYVILELAHSEQTKDHED